MSSSSILMSREEFMYRYNQYINDTTRIRAFEALNLIHSKARIKRITINTVTGEMITEIDENSQRDIDFIRECLNQYENNNYSDILNTQTIKI